MSSGLPAISMTFDRVELGCMECVAGDVGKLKAHTGYGHEVAGWVAKLGDGYGNLAGYLADDGYGRFPEGTLFAYVRVVRVAEGRRGAGVGGLLLELCCSALAEAGVRHVFLHAAAEDGWEAKLASFYERHGFAEFADVSDAYPVMYRRLRRKA